MWLSRNTKVLDSFPPQKWEVYACSMWSGYLVFGFTDDQPCYRDKHKWHSHHRRQKNYGSHTIACIHNIARVNCSTGTYFFLKQTGTAQARRHVNITLYLFVDAEWNHVYFEDFLRIGHKKNPTLEFENVFLLTTSQSRHEWLFWFSHFLFPITIFFDDLVYNALTWWYLKWLSHAW